MFNIEKFKTELYSNIDKKEAYCYPSFRETFTSLPHIHVPIKKNIFRCNNNIHDENAKKNNYAQLKTGIITKDKQTFV